MKKKRAPVRSENYRFLQVEEITPGIRVIRIHRPEVLNALTLETTFEIQRAVRQLAADRQKVGILTGTPPAFSAGGDLREVLEVTRKGGRKAVEYVYRGFQGMVRAIRETPTVVLAAVNGVAAGGGMDLAMACDLVYGCPSSRFTQSWIRLGLIPAMGGAFFVQRRAGWKGMRIVFTGEMVDGASARELGLLDGFAQDEKLLPLAMETARSIARSDLSAIRALKKLLHHQEKPELERYLKEGARVQGPLLTGPAFRAAAEAIVLKKEKSNR